MDSAADHIPDWPHLEAGSVGMRAEDRAGQLEHWKLQRSHGDPTGTQVSTCTIQP